MHLATTIKETSDQNLRLFTPQHLQPLLRPVNNGL